MQYSIPFIYHFLKNYLKAQSVLNEIRLNIHLFKSLNAQVFKKINAQVFLKIL